MTHHINLSISPLTLLKSCISNKDLLRSLIVREIVGRYKGSVLGMAWSILTPIIMLLVYNCVFVDILKARFDSEVFRDVPFYLIMFLGLLFFNLFSECLVKSPILIQSNPNYVKKIIFPLELLPFVVLGGALFQFFIGFLVWIFFHMLSLGIPSLSLFSIFLYLPSLIVFCIGTIWLVSSFGVYLKDIGQIVNLVSVILLFLSAVFFPLSMLSDHYLFWISLNPLALLIDQARLTVLIGKSPDYGLCTLIFAISVVYAWISFILFQKLRRGFSDVL